jgi:hypothetical protein
MVQRGQVHRVRRSEPPGNERAALGAVAAEVVAGKTGRHRACPDDVRHGLRRDCLRADPGQGWELARRRTLAAARRQPDA